MKHDSYEFIENVKGLALEYGIEVSEKKIEKEGLPSATIKLLIDKDRIEVGITAKHVTVLNHNTEEHVAFIKDNESWHDQVLLHIKSTLEANRAC